MPTQAPEDNVVLMRRRAEISGDALLKSAAEEIEQLRAAISRLLRYADHEEDCAAIDRGLSNCDCGYDELMAEAGEGK